MLWYSVEAPQWGASNEYPQHMFSRQNKKNVYPIPALICTYMMDTSLILQNDNSKYTEKKVRENV